MAPYLYDEHGRRVIAPSKGEVRERTILDEAEKQLVADGPEAMTVESIATAAGLTRGALYFYFRSKNDVLAALVRRVTTELSSAIATRRMAAPDSASSALFSAIDLTRDMWNRHGAVMRAAVELSPSVDSIGQLWSTAREETARHVAVILGGPADDGVADLHATVRALVAMTERVFYDAHRTNSDLNGSAAVVEAIWSKTFALSPRHDNRA